MGSLFARSANPGRLRQQRGEQSPHCSGPLRGGLVGEREEFQINTFYDHPSTNCVPLRRPLGARLCLQGGREPGLGLGVGRTRRDRGSERPAPGLNFHLPNPGPADWLRATGPPGAAAPGRIGFLSSRRTPGGPGKGRGGRRAQARWGDWPGCAAHFEIQPLRLGCAPAPLGCLSSL